MEIEATIYPKQGLMYIREEVRKILGNKVKIIPNANAVLLFPADKDYESVLKSVEVITKDLQIRAEEEKNRKK